MANEVYLRTRDALATLVSERAATRVLDAALRRSHASAEALEPRTVRQLMLGPVQRELEGILPRNGLRRTLRRLARQIAEEGDAPGHAVMEVAPRHGPPPAPPEKHLHPVTRSSVYLPDVALPADGEAGAGVSTDLAESTAPRASDGIGARDAVAVASAAVRAGGSQPIVDRGPRSRPTVVPHPLGAEALDALAVHFAAIEGVRQVVALRAASEPQVRGEGLDADALTPVAQSAVRLLGRYGPLRSLVLEHPAGLLFVFPLGRDAIAVLARANVNMGAVFAARAALEEGP